MRIDSDLPDFGAENERRKGSSKRRLVKVKRKIRFQLSGARRQGAGTHGAASVPRWSDSGQFGRNRVSRFIENEGSSGDVDENKEEQVSGVRGQVSGRSTNCWLLIHGIGSRLGFGNCGQIREKRPLQYIENEGSSGDVDENKGEQVSGVRGQVSGRSTNCWLPDARYRFQPPIERFWTN